MVFAKQWVLFIITDAVTESIRISGIPCSGHYAKLAESDALNCNLNRNKVQHVQQIGLVLMANLTSCVLYVTLEMAEIPIGHTYKCSRKQIFWSKFCPSVSCTISMRTPFFLSVLATATLSSLSLVFAQQNDTVLNDILANAKADNIDLTVLDFLDTAFKEISAVAKVTEERRALGRRDTPTPNNIVDVHTHVVPAWYKSLVPTTGGNPTPDWTLNGHFSFMEAQGIDRAIFAFSAPGPNVFAGNKILTVALARLINEQTAAYCKTDPAKHKFYAHVPFPYTAEAIVEAKYALTKLGAVGIILQSNIEGRYLGDATFTPFFKALDAFSGRQILYIHPSDPVINFNSNSISANPTRYAAGSIEFYFETARTLMDLTLTQTIHNFTNIHYVIPHVGGAFPSTVDRILKSFPALYDSSFAIYSTRFWWDSAGPTYFHQISGLLGINVPKTQLLFGSDYPYAPALGQPGSLAAVKASALFTSAEKTAIFSTNAEGLFGI